MTGKRFRVALSFAGEKRDFVAKVAAILARRFGQDAILYDKYHVAEFSRSDLAFHLPDLYEKDADLVVAVFCPDYERKEWCGLEWNAIYGLLKKRNVDEVMLARFGRVEGKGLRGLAGYTDLDDLTPEQAADLILERLAINEGKPKDHYTRPAGGARPQAKPSVPNNLPRIQPFFGREEQLEAIRDALDPESRTWGALIDGPGGMGKTTLAVRAAYDCTPDQFERIIFLSVKDREMDEDGERQLTGFILPGFLEMLNELARELGHSDIPKASEDQRVRLLLDALRPMRVLLILDNLESLTKDDRGQLLTFVKRLPQGCKAILTSRRRLGSGSELVLLPELDEKAALELLAELSQHNPLLARTSEEERKALHGKTGGNPLLLRWLAGQLGRGSCRTLDDALRFLATCPPDNDPLEFIFGDLAREFTDEETHVLAALSYFTLPARVRHIADVMGLAEEGVEIALRTLANRALVVPDQEELSYTLMPMVSEFLRRNQPVVLAAAGEHLLRQSAHLIAEHGYGKYDRFPDLDAAWPIVAAALPVYYAGAKSDILQQLIEALRVFLDFTGRWDERLRLALEAEAKAVEAGDLRSAGWRAYEAGHIHASRAQADAVVECADRAVRHWESAQAGPPERATALHLRARGYTLKGDYAKAIAAHREELKLEREISAESLNVAVCLNSLAGAERGAGRLSAAARDHRRALEIATNLEDAELIAGITSNLSQLALERDNLPEAESLGEQSLRASERLGHQELIATNCLTLALTFALQERYDAAIPHARRALEINERHGMTEREAAQKVLAYCEGKMQVEDKEVHL